MPRWVWQARCWRCVAQRLTGRQVKPHGAGSAPARPNPKSHGAATPKGVANAVGVAARMVRNDITRKIGEDLDNFRAHAFNGVAAQ